MSFSLLSFGDSHCQEMAFSDASSLWIVRLGGTLDLNFTGMRLTDHGLALTSDE